MKDASTSVRCSDADAGAPGAGPVRDVVGTEQHDPAPRLAERPTARPGTTAAIDPAEALAVLRALGQSKPPRHVYVDFDFTLCGQSSTDLFLAQARPAALYLPLFRLLGAVLRMVLPAGAARRWVDPLRLWIGLLLCPWMIMSFRRRAQSLFRAYRNQRLVTALDAISVQRITIVSFGCDFVLRTLLRGSRLEAARLVAPGLHRMVRDRRAGKLAMLRRAGAMPDPARDLAITDCDRDDADLLAYLRHGFLVRWPPCARPNPMAMAYIPFAYTARVKRSPGFLVKQILLEELPIVLLLFGLAALPGDGRVLLALVLLFLSYMTVYEIGYADNDRVGERSEAAPKLSPQFPAYRDYVHPLSAWVWSLLFAVVALAVMGEAGRAAAYARAGFAVPDTAIHEFAVLLSGWMGCVLLGALLFAGFNRATLFWRVFLYLSLQTGKMLSPLIFFPLGPAGAVLFMAHLVRMWAPYAIRRCGGDFERTSSQFIRLAFFLSFLPLVAFAAGDLSILLGWEVAVMLAFCTLRSGPELRRILTRSRTTDDPAQL